VQPDPKNGVQDLTSAVGRPLDGIANNLPQVLQCPYCDFEATHEDKLSKHVKNAHPELRSCQQCAMKFSSTDSLNQHALDTHHAAFKCSHEGCAAQFTRSDVHRRHLLRHTASIVRFPCPHCEKYQGKAGFIRKDHLTQHLRNFHRIGAPQGNHKNKACPHPTCTEYRNQQYQSRDGSAYMPFRKSSDYITHMRKVHDESPFPCSVHGCTRVRGQGYFRLADLLKHRKKAHGDMEITQEA